MVKRPLSVNVVGAEVVRSAIADLKSELQITFQFPADALAEAERAAREVTFDHLPDHRDIPFATIDPEGSRDLDQAMFIEREGDGYLVRYAIAALSLFVEPGGALDAEVHRRGVTVYLPDRSIPLHPEVLSSNAASLLPNVDRPSYLWYLHLDSEGRLTESWVELAQVRSRAQLTYQQVQASLDSGVPLPDGVPADLPELLREVGQLREEREIERGGVSLELPEQRIEKSDGGYALMFRELTDIETWNSHISLLTGMAAADMMLEHNVGILRTLPPAQERDLQRLRKVAEIMNLDWRENESYPHFVRRLDAANPEALSFMNEAMTLFRGAGYLALPVSAEVEAKSKKNSEAQNYLHAAIAAPYAHVTAPLRRLVDRYGLEVCRCLCAGEEIPSWVLDALPTLPKTMGNTVRDANTLENRAISALEALTLTGREGEKFSGVVIDVLKRREEDDSERGVIMLSEPAVEAVVTGDDLPIGKHVVVELTGVDPSHATVEFRLLDESAA